jgi:hypothetical protein
MPILAIVSAVHLPPVCVAVVFVQLVTHSRGIAQPCCALCVCSCLHHRPHLQEGQLLQGQ